MTGPAPEVDLDLVRRALIEDVRSGDRTTEAIVPDSARAKAVFLAKQNCVVAGLDVTTAVFSQLDPAARVDVLRPDGASSGPGDVIATVSGAARAILTGERTALNFLQRLSGIATLTRRFVDAAAGRITILDTRKTTPGLRALEKYAVRCGGGTNHRFGLYDAILIKDNHIRVAGGVAEAVRRVMRSAAESNHGPTPIEVEVQSLHQLEEAIQAGADTIMLDNMGDEELREAIRRIAGRARIEISGGVTLQNITQVTSLGADVVSIGALTHSAPAVDISLELEFDAEQSAG